MVNIAIAFIAGIAVFNFFSFFPFTISSISFGIILYLFFTCKDRDKVLLIIIVFTTAIFYSQLRTNELPEILLPSEEVYIIGTITNVPEMKDGSLRFSIRDVLIEGNRIPGIVKLTALLDSVMENLKINILSPGDRISSIAKLKKPRSFRNPGRYSYNTNINCVYAIGFTKQIQVINRGHDIMSWIHKKRQRLAWIIDNSLSEESAALSNAIVPGLKSGIGQEMRDGFNSTGLAHLLSISGTHFGLLAYIIFTSIRGLIKRLPSDLLVKMTIVITPAQIAVLITLPVLILYACISGASLPTVRSLIMVIIYMLALYLGRQDRWVNSLCIAAIIILVWQPGASFEVSFQLSFIAVLSIGSVMERYIDHDNKHSALNYGAVNYEKEKFFKRMVKKAGATLLITIAAVMGTAPFVVLYFNRFPLISPLTNMIITPLICFVILPLCFFTGFVALICDMPHLPLSALIDWTIHIVLRLIKVFSQIPYANVPLHAPIIVEILLYYSSLIFLFINKSGFKKKLMSVVLILIIYLIRSPLLHEHSSVTFLDVGQGESSVVRLPDNKVMLIDGGVEKPDMGRIVIAPFLWSRGITKIDCMVLSHAHPDHYGGLRYITDNFETGEVWTNGFITSHTLSILIGTAKQKVLHRSLRRGDMLEGDNYKITVLHPYEAFFADSPRGDFSNENSNSLVLKIEMENTSILFTGDIEEEAEEALLFSAEWLKSDILKVPHHGGKTSSSQSFIQAVHPAAAVVSAGRNNSFHHPHAATLQRYKEEDVQIFRTDRDGTVTINFKNGRYSILTYVDNEFLPVKYWQDEIRNLGLLF